MHKENTGDAPSAHTPRVRHHRKRNTDVYMFLSFYSCFVYIIVNETHVLGLVKLLFFCFVYNLAENSNQFSGV